MIQVFTKTNGIIITFKCKHITIIIFTFTVITTVIITVIIRKTKGLLNQVYSASVQRCIVQMIILAGPGVLLSTFCLGSALKVLQA